MKPQQLLNLINQYPKKRFGQNFLIDESVLAEILTAAELDSTETIVEIGPGLGVLTTELAKSVNRVIAIEADRDLGQYLRDHTARNVDLIIGDALQVDWTITVESDYKIVANIPYSITSPLLRKIFQLTRKPSRVVLLVQKELAERITAPVGSSDRGLLTLLTEVSAEARIVKTVKPESFYPSPKVDSAVIVLEIKPTSQKEAVFWPAVEVAFQHKRQTLANSLKSVNFSKDQTEQFLSKIGLSPMARPQELSLSHWIELSRLITNK